VATAAATILPIPATARRRSDDDARARCRGAGSGLRPDLGAPASFIEAGVSDFWVPRGYAHVIANLRGTVGSDGTYTFFEWGKKGDARRQRELHLDEDEGWDAAPSPLMQHIVAEAAEMAASHA